MTQIFINKVIECENNYQNILCGETFKTFKLSLLLIFPTTLTMLLTPLIFHASILQIILQLMASSSSVKVNFEYVQIVITIYALCWLLYIFIALAVVGKMENLRKRIIPMILLTYYLFGPSIFEMFKNILLIAKNFYDHIGIQTFFYESLCISMFTLTYFINLYMSNNLKLNTKYRMVFFGVVILSLIPQIIPIKYGAFVIGVFLVLNLIFDFSLMGIMNGSSSIAIYSTAVLTYGGQNSINESAEYIAIYAIFIFSLYTTIWISKSLRALTVEQKDLIAIKQELFDNENILVKILAIPIFFIIISLLRK